MGLLWTHLFLLLPFISCRYTTASHHLRRDLEAFNVTRVEYAAQFCNILGFYCTTHVPSLSIGCEIGELEITGTSHVAIECDYIDTSNAKCTVQCSSKQECAQIFVTSDSDDLKWGTIYYSCQALDVSGTATTFVYDSGKGTCDPSESIYLDNFNFRVARLGARCDDGAADYSFDNHRFLECGAEVTTLALDEDYACLEGQNCKFGSCEFEFDPVVVQSHPSDTEDACIQTAFLDEEPVRTEPSPNLPALPEDDYGTYYQARWSLIIDDYFCSVEHPTVEIACEGGDLVLGDALNEEVSCTKTSTSTAECTEPTGDNFVGGTEYGKGPIQKFSGINYQCRASVLAETESNVTYLESTTDCGKSGVYWESYHYLELGVFCGTNEEDVAQTRISEEAYSFDDKFVECGTDNMFDNGHDSGNYQCFEVSLQLEEGGVDGFIPAVVMESEKLQEGCYFHPPTPTDATTTSPNHESDGTLAPTPTVTSPPNGSEEPGQTLNPTSAAIRRQFNAARGVLFMLLIVCCDIHRIR